jgi:hypothetical protein
MPLSKVFVRPTLRNNDKVSVTACHEVCEMLIDPAINMWADGPNGTLYAYEMCDACEQETFEIDGVTMSDFVYPSYFERFRAPHSAQFDYLKRISRPFEILPRGYALVREGSEIRHLFGSTEKSRAFAKEDRRWHRSEYRIGTHEAGTDAVDTAYADGARRTNFAVNIEGDDLVARNVVCTWFGGPNDHQDSGETASGVNTKENPNILGCSLPMDGFHHAATDGSPIPRLPWNTFVKVRNLANNREISVPLIDLGPSLFAPSGAAIDLTESAFRLIGGSTDRGKIQVDFVIPGAAQYRHAHAMAAEERLPERASHGMSHDMPKPPIKAFIRSPNVSSRNGTKIDMVVLHFTDGPSAQSAINTFRDPNAQVSAHYIIDKNGDIYQMVEDSDKAWHAKAANPRSIGIEHVALPGEHMAAAQEASSVALVRWLIATYDVSLENIKGHRFAPGNIGTTDCPDHLFGDATEAAVKQWVERQFA